MSQLVRLEGKHSTPNAHCALVLFDTLSHLIVFYIYFIFVNHLSIFIHPICGILVPPQSVFLLRAQMSVFLHPIWVFFTQSLFFVDTTFECILHPISMFFLAQLVLFVETSTDVFSQYICASVFLWHSICDSLCDTQSVFIFTLQLFFRSISEIGLCAS